MKDRGDIRSTKEIRKAVSQLKKEGKKIDFVFYDKVPNRELKKFYEQVDIVVTQLNYGTYGLTALEGMALEKPVIAYIREKYKKYFPDLPIIDANPDNILKVLRRVIEDKNKLAEIGKKSRQFVCQYHDSEILAKKLYQMYKSLY